MEQEAIATCSTDLQKSVPLLQERSHSGKTSIEAPHSTEAETYILRPTSVVGIISPAVRNFVPHHRSIQAFILRYLELDTKYKNAGVGGGVPENFSKDFFLLEQVGLHKVTHSSEQQAE